VSCDLGSILLGNVRGIEKRAFTERTIMTVNCTFSKVMIIIIYGRLVRTILILNSFIVKLDHAGLN
jgi:hypothetical protein